MLLSVVAGYLAGTLAVTAGTWATSTAFGMRSGAAVTPKYLAVIVAVNILGAAAAGYVCARLAPAGRLALAAVLLVVLFLALALISAYSVEAGQARPYVALVTLLGLVGMCAGVMIERAMHGRRPVA
jgi:hypothetical protein